MDELVAGRALPLSLLDRAFASRAVALPGGATVAVRCAGPSAGGAPTLVLLHGIGSGAASWLRVALALAGSARVVAWDAPGYGASSPLAPARPGAHDYARRLDELLGALGVGPCVLVGHSLGALIAAAHARRFGAGRVQRLVLISPARGYGAPPQAGQRERVRTARLEALREHGIEGLARQAPARLLSAHADDAARAWVRWNAARLNPAGYAQAVHMLCDDTIDAHAELRVPVDVHVGDADTVTPPEACRGVAQRLDAMFAPIEQAGHASPVERPDAVAALIARAAGWPTQGVQR